jgi:Tol biopolymer transport system component
MKDSLLNPNKVVPSWSLEKPGFASNDFIKPKKDVQPNPDGSLEEIRAYLLKDEEDKKAKVINRLNFQGEATTQPELTFNHLFIVEAKEGAKSKALTSGFKNHNNARWLANGNILVETDFYERMHPDRELESTVSVLDTQKLTIRMLMGENRMNYSGVFYAPNGSRLSFFKSPTEGVNFPNLFIANADGTNAQQVPIDRSVANVAWSKDSRYLYFTAPTNGGQPLYRFEIGSAKVEQLSDTDTGILAFDVSADKVLYAKTEVATPAAEPNPKPKPGERLSIPSTN